MLKFVCRYIDYSTNGGWKLVSIAHTKKCLAMLYIELGIDSKMLKFFTLPMAFQREF